MGNCASFREDVHVIIVGGGFSGLQAARDLDPYVRVTLIDKRESFFVNFGSVRAIVEPGFENTLFIDYNKVLKHGKFIQGEVTAVAPTSATVRRASGATETISGNYVVLATGSSYPAPMKAAALTATENVAAFQRIQSAIGGANSIVIVGGGATAVESAGEIKAARPNATVTLLHSGPTLLAGAQNGTNGPFSPKFIELLNTKLSSLGVVVRPNTRVLRPAALPASEAALLTPTTLQTTSMGGEPTAPINADVALFLVGGSPNTGVIRSSFPGAVDAEGFVSVTETLNLVGHSTVFVTGDVASSTTTHAAKTALAAKEQGAHVAKAIRAVIAGKPTPLYPAKPSTMAAIVLGRKTAIGYGNGSLFPEFVVRMLKAGDYYAGNSRKGFTGSAK